MKLNIGIIFGGPSRQREQSFQNARSLFTNLDRQLFEPVPIFADSQKRLYLLDWKLLFQKSLADFFPGSEPTAFSEMPFPVYEESLSGGTENSEPPALREKAVPVDTLPQRIHFAIIALCGTPEEEEWAHKLLESAKIPYAGHGPKARKHFKSFAEVHRTWITKGVQTPVSGIIRRGEWKPELAAEIFQSAAQNLGIPFKVFSTADPAHYARIDQEADLAGFREAVETSFYEERLPVARWQEMNLYERAEHLQLLTDLRIGLGFPVYVSVNQGPRTLVNRPEALMHVLNTLVSDPTLEDGSICYLSSTLPAGDVVLEGIPAGKPFWITVLPSEQGPSAFPPIGRQGHHDLYGNGSGDWSEGIFSTQESEVIRRAVEQMALDTELKQVFTVSGRITRDGIIYFEQIHTGIQFTPGTPLYLASAQAGLLPCTWLSALLYFNLQARIAEYPSAISWRGLLEYFREILAGKAPAQAVGILYTAPLEKQTIPESTAQVVQFLSAEGHFRPIPLLLEQINNIFYLREQLPVPLIRGEGTATSLPAIPALFHPMPEMPLGRFSFAQLVQTTGVVFLDTRGVPVQGRLQRELKSHGIAFNGPGAAAAGVAGHPFQCMEALRRNTDLVICGQILLSQAAFAANPDALIQRIESRFPYPFAGTAVGLGTLSIQRREALEAFIRLLFRPEGTEGKEARKILRIKEHQFVPIQKEILFQELTRPHGARYLLPLSVPIVCKIDQEGNPVYHFPGPAERQGDRVPPILLAQERPHFDQLAPALQNAITIVSNKAAETAARVLNLQGAVCVDLTVRIYENDHIEPVIESLEVLPEWKLSDPLVRALIRHGEFPGETLSGILYDSLAKPHLEQLALAAQTEHISAPGPSAGALNLDPGLHLETQAHNTTPSMENTPPPPSRSTIQEIRNRLPATGIIGIIQEWLLQFWYFIRSAIFLKNLGAAILFIFLLINLISVGLKLYTNHGQAVEVQDYQGMTAREARRKARSRSFTTLINDSVYIVGKAPNIVLDQIPKPGSRIKKNRFIYLTVSSSTPPNIPLPSLVGGNDDFEQYRKKLERLGIKARVKDREFNAELEENTILYLFFKGKRIEPSDLKRGIKVPKGSVLEVVVSIRNTGTVDIPDLVCRTYEEAVFLLQSSQLTVGSVFAPGEPLPWHYVYKQEPAFNPSLKLSVGEGINLYLQEEKPENCNEL